MKKLVCLLLALLSCCLLAGCGKISSEKAIDLALAELNLSRVTTPRVDATLDETSGSDIYRVVIYQSYENQIVMVDAKTGEILSKTVEDAKRG